MSLCQDECLLSFCQDESLLSMKMLSFFQKKEVFVISLHSLKYFFVFCQLFLDMQNHHILMEMGYSYDVLMQWL